MPLVVDASVALSWCLRDESDEYAEGILDRLARDTVVVPSIWPVELANGLLVAERRGRVTSADTAEAQSILSDLRLAIEDFDLNEVLLQLARTERLTVYDACYLRLAMTQGIPLASLDDDLRDACLRVGVPLA